MQLRLFRHSAFAISCALMLVIFSVLLGTTLLLPQLAQTELGYTAQKAGELLTPGGFVILLLMPLVGYLVSHVDARYLIGSGLLIFAFALMRMAHVDSQVDFRTVMLWRVYQAAGMAFVFVPINTMAYTDMPREASNQVSAMTNLMRNIGGSIGISAVTTLLARRQQIHQGYLASNLYQYNPRFQQALTQLTQPFTARTDPTHAAQQAYGQIYRQMQNQASYLAYMDIFHLLAIVSVLTIVLLLFAGKTKPGQAAMAH